MRGKVVEERGRGKVNVDKRIGKGEKRRENGNEKEEGEV